MRERRRRERRRAAEAEPGCPIPIRSMPTSIADPGHAFPPGALTRESESHGDDYLRLEEVELVPARRSRGGPRPNRKRRRSRMYAATARLATDRSANASPDIRRSNEPRPRSSRSATAIGSPICPDAFRVLASGQRHDPPSATRGRSHPRSGDSVRVMIVEDELLLREGIVRLLAAHTSRRRHRRRSRDPAAHSEIGVLVGSHYIESSYALRLLEDQPERCGYFLKERVSDVGGARRRTRSHRRRRVRCRRDDRQATPAKTARGRTARRANGTVARRSRRDGGGPIQFTRQSVPPVAPAHEADVRLDRLDRPRLADSGPNRGPRARPARVP